MKTTMSYREQIERAKQVVNGWPAEQKSWMQPQGTNEYVERRVDFEERERLLRSELPQNS